MHHCTQLSPPRWRLALLSSLFAAGLLTGCSSSESDGRASEAQTSTPIGVTTEPVVGEQLQIVPPNGWQLTASSNTGKFRRARYERTASAEQATEGVAARDVVESLTFEYLDPTGLPEPIAFLESMAAEQAQRCENFSSTGIGAARENGYPSAVRLLSCPYRKVNKRSTVSLAKAIAGNAGYYLVVFEKQARAQRNETGWSTDHVSESDIASWSLYLRRTRVCDSERSEHPCN